MRAIKTQLGLLLVAGTVSVRSWIMGGIDVAFLVAGIAFAGAAAFRFDQLAGRPHRTWYEGRAAAESAKTLSWLYAVGGSPFEIHRSDVDPLFVNEVEGLVSDLDALPKMDDSAGAPTGSMKELRTQPLATRIQAYREGRILDQENWYRSKSNFNQARARLWGRLVLFFEAAGAIGAFLVAFRVITIDLLGIAGAAAATGAAWLETRQHQNLASAYRVAADELRSVSELMDRPLTEEEWAIFAADAEQAISREHTLWRARTSRAS